MSQENLERLKALQTLKEHTFYSRLPLIGPAVAWLRDQLNSVSTKWYVRALLEQQNAFNAAVVSQLSDHEAQLAQLTQLHNSLYAELKARLDPVEKRLPEHEAWLLQQDHECVALTRDIAEMTAQLVRENRSLSELAQRVADLEAAAVPGREKETME